VYNLSTPPLYDPIDTEVIKSRENLNLFFFYELWKDFAAFSSHKKEPHFKLWDEFKKSGGTKSDSVLGGNGVFISSPGVKFYNDNVTNSSDTIGMAVEAEILPEKMDDFLKCIKQNAEGSRAEAGCLQFGKAYCYSNTTL